MSGRELLFSVTRKDLRVDTFRSGGSGGQNQNKRDTGVRIVHAASGAVGESRTHREQGRNRREALRRMVSTKAFQAWLKVESSRRFGTLRDIERDVDRMMQPKHLKVEYLGADGEDDDAR